MTLPHPHDYIQSYEAGVEALKTKPTDRDLQHKVVLSLARAGALDFAILEYERFGLGVVRDHEDIMALNGRLSKDLFLRSSGKKALDYAHDAARKYEFAFQNTLGYYSGINSATMAFMADMPADRVNARIEAIEALLPVSRGATPRDHYFTEATRAECFLLRGERAKAAEALHAAIDFDPMNYAAHATTLKQFIMICRKQEENLDWLSNFKPPRPLHYAGHIRLERTGIDQDALEISISDALQYEDVGFGYGALAAGGDILFAENLLEQGAELHVILPCSRDVFKRESVVPFGENWVERFEACMAGASSIRVLSPNATWPDRNLNRLSGLSAMGHATLKGQSLSVDPLQMLILKDIDAPSYTAVHARDWSLTGHAQFGVSASGLEQISPTPVPVIDSGVDCALKTSDGIELVLYPTVAAAVEAAMDIRAMQEKVKIALHLDLDGEDTVDVLDSILKGGSPQSLLVSESFASVLAAVSGGRHKITYAGQIKLEAAGRVRCYTVQSVPASTYALA